jgi:hypothetical protein
MKALVFLAIIATTFSSFAELVREDFAPHFSPEMPIVWQAETNQLPNGFWTYKRLPPHPFSETVISNALILASLEHIISPKSSTNDFFYHEDMGPNYPGTIPDIFCIIPKFATISYGLPHPGTNTTDIPADKMLVQRAWTYAAQLGVNPAQIAFKEMTSHFNQDESGDELTNQLCGRGVFLSRKLDGILFWSSGTQDESVDGFWIEFGSHGRVRAFSLVWPDLKRDELQPAATPQQIISCIRAFKTMSLPNGNEPGYFERLKKLAKAKKLTITRIVPYYIEGIYGKTPTNDGPPQLVAPIVELEAVANFGNSNANVRLLAPILSSEANKLSNAPVQPAQLR